MPTWTSVKILFSTIFFGSFLGNLFFKELEFIRMAAETLLITNVNKKMYSSPRKAKRASPASHSIPHALWP